MKPTLRERKKEARLAGPLTLGKFLWCQRKDRGFRLKEVSASLGVTPSFLSAIENGGKIPSDLVLAEIAREYGSQEAWIFALAGRVQEPVRALLQREPETGMMLADLAKLESADVLVPLLQRMVDGALRREESDRARAAEQALPSRRRKTG